MRDITNSLNNKSQYYQGLGNGVGKLLKSHYTGEEDFRHISPSAVLSTRESIATVLRGERPLALTGRDGFISESDIKRLSEKNIKIIRFNYTECDDIYAKNFNGVFYNLKPGQATTWIIYRKGHKKKALLLMKIHQRNKHPKYREQLIGQLLSYPAKEVESFCKKNNMGYSKRLSHHPKYQVC